MINKKFRSLMLLSFLSTIIFFLALLVSVQFSRAQSSSNAYSAPDNSDAIAVRIVPNPNHLSIASWYASQGFQGSPQALLVDGYEAIRDGRTVYVNAANVTGNPPSIYTNIYLISYNQNPAPNTVDILGQIVSHWKFNTGLADNTNPNPTCSISSVSCSSNTDCASGQYCASSGLASSSCVLEQPVNCSTDADCPANFFCDSLKSKITRDVKRVGELADIKAALNNFMTANGHYPMMSAGTYLTGNSVSLWPSWTQSLLSDLAVAQSAVDPINRLGACPGFDQTTCWNNDTKRFYSTASPLTTLTLPAGSYAFAYSTNNSGSNYNLCATMESRGPGLNYHFAPNDPSASTCVVATGVGTGGQAGNSAPQLVASLLTGEAGQTFDGFIKVVDPDGDPLIWSINPSPQTWTNWQNNGQNNKAPILLDTSNPSQKKVYAQLAGAPGKYNMSITVNDGRGGILTTSTPITILTPGITIQAENANFVLNSSPTFSYSFSFYGSSITNPSGSYTVTKTAGPTGINPLSGLTATFSSNGLNYQVNYSGSLPASLNLSQGSSFTYNITVKDKYNKSISKYFTINIIPEPINLNFNCSPVIRAGAPYSCVLGNASSDLKYTASGLPAGLTISSIGTNGDEGLTGTAQSTGLYSVTVTATDSFGTKVQKNFNLQVTSFCGDGSRETPNTEGAGGPNNDGYEDCDGASGVTTNVAGSNIRLQYGCTTGVGQTTTYPILASDQCVYESPVKGGGYCGDGYCEATTPDGKTPLETCSNCPQDCSTCSCTPDCTNKPNGSNNNCGGTCVVSSNTCGGLIADQEGQVYGTVNIGYQCWMSQNINTGEMLNSASQNPNPKNAIVEKWCYNNEPANCTQYGGLYNWPEAMANSVAPGAQGICPTGWHVPTDGEFKILETKLGMSTTTADSQGAMSRGISSQNPDDHAVGTQLQSGGTSGFNALMSGYLFASNNSYSGLGSATLFISSTLANATSDFIRGVSSMTGEVGVDRYPIGFNSGLSLRCLKNCAPTCQGQICGSPDGCGSTCAAGSGCCTPATCSNLGATCGNVSDNCGGTLTCGKCGANQHCTANNTCADNCVPKTCANAAPDGGAAECGTPQDTCGKTLACGACNANQTCTNLNTCENKCTPKTCANAGFNGAAAVCGTPSDDCVGTLNCGAASEDCNTALAVSSGYIGLATCSKTYSWDSSACQVDMSQWRQAPDDTYTPNGAPCMVRMNVDSNNILKCDSSMPTSNAQWFRGQIVVAGNTLCSNSSHVYLKSIYCSVSYRDTSGNVVSCGDGLNVNANKCRWYANCASPWTGYCYIHN